MWSSCSSAQHGDGWPANWGRAKLPDVDAAHRSVEASGKRRGIGGGGEPVPVVIAEQLPTIPLVVRNSVWVSRPNVHGWLPHQYDIYPHYNDVWLDQG